MKIKKSNWILIALVLFYIAFCITDKLVMRAAGEYAYKASVKTVCPTPPETGIN